MTIYRHASGAVEISFWHGYIDPKMENKSVRDHEVLVLIYATS